MVQIIRFRIQSGRPLDGALKYSNTESSFLFEVADQSAAVDRFGAGGKTSVVIGTLQIETAVSTGELLYLWGYFPNVRWQTASLSVPRAEPGEVYVDPPDSLQEGASVRAFDSAWTTRFDPTQGWIRVGLPSMPETKYVEISGCVILGIHEAHLESVWLHPIFED